MHAYQNIFINAEINKMYTVNKDKRIALEITETFLNIGQFRKII